MKAQTSQPYTWSKLKKKKNQLKVSLVENVKYSREMNVPIGWKTKKHHGNLLDTFTVTL